MLELKCKAPFLNSFSQFDMWKSPPTVALYASCLLPLIYWVLDYWYLLLMHINLYRGCLTVTGATIECKAHGVAIIQYWENGEVVCMAVQPFYKLNGFLLRTSDLHSKAPFLNVSTCTSVFLSCPHPMMVQPAFIGFKGWEKCIWSSVPSSIGYLQLSILASLLCGLLELGKYFVFRITHSWPR